MKGSNKKTEKPPVINKPLPIEEQLVKKYSKPLFMDAVPEKETGDYATDRATILLITKQAPGEA